MMFPEESPPDPTIPTKCPLAMQKTLLPCHNPKSQSPRFQRSRKNPTTLLSEHTPPLPLHLPLVFLLLLLLRLRCTRFLPGCLAWRRRRSRRSRRSSSHMHRRCTRGSGADSGDAVFGPLVTVVGGADVPHVGFEWIAPAAHAHFREPGDGVFGLRKTY